MFSAGMYYMSLHLTQAVLWLEVGALLRPFLGSW